MKRYIRSSSTNSNAVNAKMLRDQVIDALESEGFSQFYNIDPARKAGMSGAEFSICYRYSEPNVEYLLSKYAAKFGEEAARSVVSRQKAEYRNFEAIKNLTRYTPAEEDFHDPLHHSGGGFSGMDATFYNYVADLVESVRSDAIVEMDRSGLYGIETYLIIKIFVPKA